MPKIFISYRRQDSQYVTDNIYEHMVRHFGRDDVFLDVGSIPFGVDFREHLHDQIAAHDVVLVMIGPDWARIMAERTDQPNDFVRIEIENALNLDKLVIPVLVKDAQMPDFSTLPESIQDLQWRNMAEIQRQPRLEEDCNRLANGIKAYFGMRRIQSDSPADEVDTSAVKTITDILPPPFEWIGIPAGKVTIVGLRAAAASFVENRYESKTYDVPSFAIARYPITNAQFQVFVDAPDGYSDPRWWDYSRDAQAWRRDYMQPHETPFAESDHPRTNVCWFEAVAFCLWLSKVTDENIMLPTEQQWQRAALGDTGWAYPWGNHWDGSRCNTSAPVASDSASPVGFYEGKGDSPFGVVDMIGNVAEWCLTDHKNGSNAIRQRSDSRVQRGGSWQDTLANIMLRADSRLGGSPNQSNNRVGFRIARS
jgi:formylglycine-generating enzyme required for sulfatase activity